MTKGERFLMGIAMAFIMLGIASVMTAFAYDFTVRPMVKNYRECGTIFLCSAQP